MCRRMIKNNKTLRRMFTKTRRSKMKISRMNKRSKRWSNKKINKSKYRIKIRKRRKNNNNLKVTMSMRHSLKLYSLRIMMKPNFNKTITLKWKPTSPKKPSSNNLKRNNRKLKRCLAQSPLSRAEAVERVDRLLLLSLARSRALLLLRNLRGRSHSLLKKELNQLKRVRSNLPRKRFNKMMNTTKLMRNKRKNKFMFQN
jgi:hypothetical protein